MISDQHQLYEKISKKYRETSNCSFQLYYRDLVEYNLLCFDKDSFKRLLDNATKALNSERLSEESKKIKALIDKESEDQTNFHYPFLSYLLSEENKQFAYGLVKHFLSLFVEDQLEFSNSIFHNSNQSILSRVSPTLRRSTKSWTSLLVLPLNKVYPNQLNQVQKDISTAYNHTSLKKTLQEYMVEYQKYYDISNIAQPQSNLLQESQNKSVDQILTLLQQNQQFVKGRTQEAKLDIEKFFFQGVQKIQLIYYFVMDDQRSQVYAFTLNSVIYINIKFKNSLSSEKFQKIIKSYIALNFLHEIIHYLIRSFHNSIETNLQRSFLDDGNSKFGKQFLQVVRLLYNKLLLSGVAGELNGLIKKKEIKINRKIMQKYLEKQHLQHIKKEMKHYEGLLYKSGSRKEELQMIVKEFADLFDNYEKIVKILQCMKQFCQQTFTLITQTHQNDDSLLEQQLNAPEGLEQFIENIKWLFQVNQTHKAINVNSLSCLKQYFNKNDRNAVKLFQLRCWRFNQIWTECLQLTHKLNAKVEDFFSIDVMLLKSITQRLQLVSNLKISSQQRIINEKLINVKDKLEGNGQSLEKLYVLNFIMNFLESYSDMERICRIMAIQLQLPYFFKISQFLYEQSKTNINNQDSKNWAPQTTLQAGKYFEQLLLPNFVLSHLLNQRDYQRIIKGHFDQVGVGNKMTESGTIYLPNNKNRKIEADCIDYRNMVCGHQLRRRKDKL